MISALYNELLYRPLFNGLVFLYETIAGGDLGIAIILLTILIRFVLYPLFHLSTKSQLMMQALQPDIKKIQDHHKHNKEEKARALMALYKERNVNPFSGFLLLFLQLPILIALYQVFYYGFSEDALAILYSFVPRPGLINYSFLGLLNLNEQSTLMVGFAALVQFLQGWLALPKRNKGEEGSTQEKMGRQMVFLGPLITVVILYNLPSAVGLYWATTALFSVGQQYLIKRSLEKKPSDHGKESGTVGAIH
ncbi:MAG: YidC/Oxa1 family membrane protein insertase [bacterium]|nr:YidC/Oxa1 family membrane protein insertase [bacterium]